MIFPHVHDIFPNAQTTFLFLYIVYSCVLPPVGNNAPIFYILCTDFDFSFHFLSFCFALWPPTMAGEGCGNYINSRSFSKISRASLRLILLPPRVKAATPLIISMYVI